MRATLLSLLVLAAAAPAVAQQIGEPLPGRKDEFRAKRQSPAPVAAARPCPEYGPGFVRMEGSTACVRVGGRVRAEFGKSSRSEFGTRTTGQVVVETRADTWAGPFTGVFVGGGAIGRGPDLSPIADRQRLSARGASPRAR